MSEFATMLQDMYYAHSHEYYHRLWSLEEIMGLSRSVKYRDDYTKCTTQYEDLLRRYGARTDLSREVLMRIAKKENRDIIEDGNLLHLGNAIQPCTVSAPCTEGNDMGRKNITYMYEGKKYSTTGDTFADAVENAIKKHCVAPAQIESDAPLFEPYAEKFFERKSRKGWKEGTIRNNRTLLNRHLLPFFGDMKIDEITLDVVQTFFNLKMDDPDPRGKSQSNLNKMQLLLGQVLNEAVEDEIIKKNPAKSSRLVVEGIPEKERKPLTEQQTRHVISQLGVLPLQDQLIIALPLFTGMRRGEFLGLDWGHVDLERRMVYVEEGRNARFKGNQPFLTTLKAPTSERYIAIPDFLHSLLVQCPNKQGFVIGGGSEPITESTYDRAWGRIVKIVEMYGATAHHLRHTYATLIDGTVSSLDTKYTLGHADIETTSRYAHKGEETVKRTQSAINGRFVQLFSDNSHGISHGQEATSA